MNAPYRISNIFSEAGAQLLRSCWTSKLFPLGVLLLASSASAQVVTNVYNFTGKHSSGNPSLVTPVQGRDGALYGSSFGPFDTFGSIFRITTAGQGSTPSVFDGTDGAAPEGGVTLSSDGNFYGTTSAGGGANYGVLFRIAPDGAYTVLHEFAGGSDGAEPVAAPIEGSDGNFYGTTYGSATTGPTVYRYTPSGAFSTIYQFSQREGQYVFGGLIQATNGNLYGTASQGGVSNCGTIFELSTSGSLVWYYSFPCGRGGSQPDSPPTQASDGNLYGTTDRGGNSAYPGFGTIYKIDQSGSVTILYSMTGIGENPLAGLTQATDGNLYGVSLGGGRYGRGTLFQVTTSGSYKLLFSFPPQIGGIPNAALFQDTNGLLYGTTPDYGKFGYGSVYSVDLGLAPFVAFVQYTGAAGDTAQILGQGLTGATAVSFNGVTATNLKVFSDTYITAVVPSGATTGPVVVTTTNGTLTSNKSFTIIGGAPTRTMGPRKAN